MIPFEEVLPNHRLKKYFHEKIVDIISKIDKYGEDDLCNFEKSLKNIYLDLSELDELMKNIYEFRYYFGTFRFSDKNISKYRYLRKNIIDYNTMVYILKERIQKVLNKLKKVIITKDYGSEYKDYYKKLQTSLMNAFKDFKERRNDITHSENIETKNLIDIGTYESLLTNNFEKSYQKLLDEKYKQERKIYKNMAIHEYAELVKYLNRFYDFLAILLLDKELLGGSNKNIYGVKQN